MSFAPLARAAVGAAGLAGAAAVLSTGIGTNLPSLAGGVYGSITNQVPDEYKTVLRVTSTDSSVNGVTLMAHTPGEVNFQIDGNWQDKGGTIGEWGKRNGVPGLGGLTKGVSGESVRDFVKVTTGLTEYNKYLTAPIWGGSSPLHLQFSFEFHATHDPLREVWLPAYFLAALGAPYEFLSIPGTSLPTGMLHAPGPTILPSSIMGDILSALQGDRISIYIGRMLYFKDIILRNVSVNVLNRLWIKDKSLPVAMKVDVEFQTYFVTTRQDLAKYFRVEQYQGQIQQVSSLISAAASNKAQEAQNLIGEYLV